MNQNSSIYATMACICVLVALVASSLSVMVSGSWLVVSLGAMIVFALCVYLSIHRHEYNEV